MLKRNQQRQTWPAAAIQRPLGLFPDAWSMSQKQWLKPKAREVHGGPVVKDLTLAAKGLGSIPGQRRSCMARSQKIKIHKYIKKIIKNLKKKKTKQNKKKDPRLAFEDFGEALGYHFT